MRRPLVLLLPALAPMLLGAQDGGAPVRQDADRGQALFDQGFRQEHAADSVVPPAWPEGRAALLREVQARMRYPQEARAAGVAGRVVVAFTVSPEGTPEQLRVQRPVHPLLDAEALRVVGTLTGWVPGARNGRPAAMRVQVPVAFGTTP